MFPKKLGKIEINKEFDNIVEILLDKFKDGEILVLENENELQQRKFTLKKRNKIFDVFDRKLIMSEINGHIMESQIDFRIEMTIILKSFYWFDLVLLIILSLGFLSNGEYESSFTILIFIILMTVVTYFWLKSELIYLEYLFQEEWRYV